MKKMKQIKKLLVGILFTMILIPSSAMAIHAEEATNSGYNWKETYNMAVSTDQAIADGLPKDLSDETYVKWATPSYAYTNGQPTNAVFLNGRLYRSANGTMMEIDVETGEVLKEVKQTEKSGYNYFLSTGDNMIFIEEGQKVEAFDEDLNQLWISDSMESGDQGLTPLTYADGYIYGGTVSTKAGTGCYFCLKAEDGSVVWKKEAELASCGSNKTYTGFYWAGSAVIGDYLVYGSEGGRVYSVNRATGEIVDRFDTSEDFTTSIRDSIAYDNGYIYFATTSGVLYKVAYDQTTGLMSNEKHIATSSGASNCTATPTIYNNRLYIGDNKHLAVFDVSGDALTNIYEIDTSAYGILRDIRIVVDAENNCVYGFTQYQKTPGSILMFKDAAGQTSGEVVDFSALTKNYSVQYSASMPIFGPDGTIYMSTDAGVMMAISINTAYISDIEVDGSLNEEFVSCLEEGEVVVAPGTQTVTLNMTVSDNTSVTVNNNPTSVTGNNASVQLTLENKKAIAKIVVSDGTATRTYQVTVREAATDATLNIANTKVNESNSYTGKALEMTGLTDSVYHIYGCGEKFKRLWVATNESNATYKAYALTDMGTNSKVDAETKEITHISTSASSGYYYKALYWADDATDMGVRIEVTAEDGVTTENYYILLTKESTTSAVMKNITNSILPEKLIAMIEDLDEDVDIGSNKEITKIEQAYALLDNEYKALVANYQKLVQIRNSYNDKYQADVFVTAQKAGSFLIAPQTLRVSADTAENYGFTDNVTDGVSVLDVLIAEHIAVYGAENVTTDTISDYLEVNSFGWIDKAFKEASGIGFTVNGQSPHDNVLGDYGYTGYTANQAKVATDDIIEFFFYIDTVNYEDLYASFAQGFILNAECEETIQLDLSGYNYVFYSNATEETIKEYTVNIAGAQLAYVNKTTGELTDIKDARTDENGKVSFSIEEVGNYYIVAYLPNDLTPDQTTSASMFMPILRINVELSASQKVVSMIDSIGTVSLNSASQIEAAEKAYNALTDAQKAYVTNLSVLQQARTTYNQLLATSYVDYFKNATATIGAASYAYNGTAITPAVTLKNGNTTLKAGTDYTVAYENNVNAGTAQITVKGAGIYANAAAKTITFNITAKNISSLTYSKVADKVYSGKAIKPSVTVKDGSVTLTSKKDYTIKYSSNKKVGTAKITIKGNGNYTGTKTISFKINPKATKITKISKKGKTATIRWTKVKNATSYKIYRATSKNGKYTSVATVKSSKNTYTNKKLQSGKTYYYKVVVCQKASGKTYSSKDSAVKTVKISK